MYLADLTTEDVANLERNTPVVLPFAAIEQHGPHLPIGTDSYIVRGILERLEARDTQSCLWLPVQCFGSSPHHMPFPGTVTLSSRSFLDVALDLAKSVAAHGFQRLIFLNGHGGNQAHLDVAVQELRMGGGSRVEPTGESRPLRAIHVTYWRLAAEAFTAIRETELGGMGHAGEMETSAMLVLRPDLVRRDAYVTDGKLDRCRLDARDMLDGGSVGQFRFFDESSSRGPIGDPRSANAEKGERFLDAAVDGLLEAIRELSAGNLG